MCATIQSQKNPVCTSRLQSVGQILHIFFNGIRYYTLLFAAELLATSYNTSHSSFKTTNFFSEHKGIQRGLLKFIYSEKATNFCKIFTILLTACTVVKSKGKILQNFVAFSEYMNFNKLQPSYSTVVYPVKNGIGVKFYHF